MFDDLRFGISWLRLEIEAEREREENGDGRTGVQDGRVPSKSAQMSMPQNPMKFELEVPGML